MTQVLTDQRVGALAVRLYGKGDRGVLPVEDVVFGIQKAVLLRSDF